MDPYIYSREINNGLRETSLFDTQSNTGQGSSGPSPAGYAVERFARKLKGLSWQRAEREGSRSDDEEEEEEHGRGRGRVRRREGGARNAGIVRGGMGGNVSFKGDIRGLDDDGASAFV